MTTNSSELIEEALWALKQTPPDVCNAVICLGIVAAELSAPSKPTSRKKSSKKRKLSKKTPICSTLELKGTLPVAIFAPQFRAAVTPLLDDWEIGPVTYLGFQRMNNGTFCFNFKGKCPVHKREHTDVGPWQIKMRPSASYAGIKCWKNESSFVKINPLSLWYIYLGILYR
jgi:hypothetical protein